MSSICLSLVALLASAAELQRSVHLLLEDQGGSVAKTQETLAQVLGWTVHSPSGVMISAPDARVADLPLEALFQELGRELPVIAHFEAAGRGPELMRFSVPVAEARAVEVFQRLEQGWWKKLEAPVARAQGYALFRGRPGRYVVRFADKLSRPDFSNVFSDEPMPSRDPEAKKNWRLFRVAPREITGPVPLILVHGAGTDRWADFIDWCRFSPEAAAFRQHYQVWNYVHERRGVNSPVGFDPDCPAFEESVVAYLERFLRQASEEGVESEGELHFFPDGPFSMITNSHGALKARAFAVHFPEYGERLRALVTLGGPHAGTPLSTVEWMQHTAGSFGLRAPNYITKVLSDAVRSHYMSIAAQSDLDNGWANFDAAGGHGIPHRAFRSWSHAGGWEDRVLSPRDANQTGARELPGYEDDITFQPQQPLETYCGGADLIHPQQRGDLYTDRIYAYASYIEPGRDWLQAVLSSLSGAEAPGGRLLENAGLRLTGKLLAAVETPAGEWPLGTYRMNDGFIPLQSQLFLDGTETEFIYETEILNGWQVPILPLRLNWDVIREHTLIDPDHIRLYPGWSHLETVTGRYNRFNGHSELFQQVAEDLIRALEGE